MSIDKPKNILMISPYLPWPLHGGSSVRIFNLIKELTNRGYNISLLAGGEEDPPKDNPLIKMCDQIYLYRIRKESAFVSAILSIFSLQPYPVLKFQTPSLREKLSNILKNKKFDLIWVNLSILVDAIPLDYIKNSPIILDHPECEEWVYKDYIKNGKVSEKFFGLINLIKLPKFKKRVFSKVSAIMCVSETEAAFTKKQTKTPIYVVPNGVDVDFFRENINAGKKSNSIIFCGNMSVRRNIDAAFWFTHKIFLKIKERVPDAEFWIVGSNPSLKILNLRLIKDVYVTGTVNNIRDYYVNGKVFVSPYHFGAGTRLKVLEAMASGIPVVSTPIGCRGMDVINNEHFLIANSENDFSECVIGLLKNEKMRKTLIVNSLELIEKKYRWKKIVDDFEKEIFNVN